MKGKLIKTEEGWMVGTVCYADIWSELLPLHPADVEQINRDAQVFDNIEARIAAYPEVEFEVEKFGEAGMEVVFAKLIISKEEPKDVILGYKTSIDNPDVEYFRNKLFGTMGKGLPKKYFETTDLGEFDKEKAESITRVGQKLGRELQRVMEQKTIEEEKLLRELEGESDEEPKQETLEEAASKWSLEEAQKFALSKFKKENSPGVVTWKSVLDVLTVGVLTGHKFGAKWQEERMYSEEEVRLMLSESFKASQEGYDITADDIIKQFKKK
jgi:hypothetical protein